MQKRMARAGWGMVLALALVGACSGSPRTAGPTDSNSAGAATSGAGGASESRPEIPYFSCDKFGLEVVAPMAAEACPAVGCDACSLPPVGWVVADGCLTSLDCEAVCDPASVAEWVSCLYVYRHCTADADCDVPQRCFIPPDQDHGLCGNPNEDCIATADCAEGSACVAARADGKRRCLEPRDGSPCNADEHCADGRCLFLDASSIGVCSSGALRERCRVDADCEAGLVCGASVCSDRKHESSCRSDDQCESHSCRSSTCVDGRDLDYCEQDSDCQSGVCVLGIRCGDGQLDQICEFDSDCLSGNCAIASPYAACTDGVSGSKCGEDADCASGACGRDPELRPGAYFGVCD